MSPIITKHPLTLLKVKVRNVYWILARARLRLGISREYEGLDLRSHGISILLPTTTCQPRQGNPHIPYSHVHIQVCCSHTPCSFVHWSFPHTAPELTAFDPTAIGGNMEVQTEVDIRDHGVGLMNLIPCPLGSISASPVGGVSNPGPNHCLKLGTIEGQRSYR